MRGKRQNAVKGKCKVFIVLLGLDGGWWQFNVAEKGQ